jgi:outer membrane protein assembly factor BamD (BamD/ComL family)
MLVALAKVPFGFQKVLRRGAIMSLIGILSSNLFGAGPAKNTQSSQNNPSKFQQIKTEFQQLGQDLQSGNLQAAQQDYSNLRQDVQQIASQQAGKHHHHYHADGSQSASSSSEQSNPIAQAFNTLAQDLLAGNLSAAQSAFATLQNDLQQIGGFLPGGSSGPNGAAAPVGAGSLNVTA